MHPVDSSGLCVSITSLDFMIRYAKNRIYKLRPWDYIHLEHILSPNVSQKNYSDKTLHYHFPLKNINSWERTYQTSIG